MSFKMIFIMCFMLIFPLTQSYTDPTVQKKSLFSGNCITNIRVNTTFIDCVDVDINDLTNLLEKEVENFPIGKRTIDYLYIQNLLVENGKLSKNWIETTSFRISELQIIAATIETIESYAFMGFAFEEMKYLTFKEMKIDSLEEGIFVGLPLLLALTINKCEINHINENTLKAVAPHLESLHLTQMVLPINPTILTGTIPLPNLTFFGLTYSNVGSLNADSFSQIENCEILYLHWSQIEHIGCGTFEKMTSIMLMTLDSNRLTTLDSCVFGDEVISGFGKYAISFGDNKWNCSCNLKWLKQLKTENKTRGNPTCASHSDLPFDEVNFCEEEP
ncbi:uncharacterized protein LOC143918213 [Arctopsyche grandis]|uniref:uncharacterized protein LOC143918213 n=1 Tax=Arctopsyche grandis TaxID=121162 RepID=UPI00406D7A42